MGKTINIFDVEMECLSAKELMLNVIRFLETDAIDTIELMTMDMLMAGQDDPKWKAQVGELGLVIPEESEILEAAGIEDKSLIKEAGERTFLRMFMKFLQKNQKGFFCWLRQKKSFSIWRKLSGDMTEVYGLRDMLSLWNRKDRKRTPSTRSTEQRRTAFFLFCLPHIRSASSQRIRRFSRPESGWDAGLCWSRVMKREIWEEG